MTTLTSVIQRQYDELIAASYDLDPQSVATGAVARAVDHLADLPELAGDDVVLRALDVGTGTGRFFAALQERGLRIAPYGLDASPEMLRIAQARVPDLCATLGDASELDRHFPGERFDVVSTHFVTGYVPIAQIATTIHDKLRPGGYWSFVGGTLRAFPALRRVADSRLFRRRFSVGDQRLEDHVINPTDDREVAAVMRRAGFEVRTIEVSRPPLRFVDFDEFMEFAHRGGWLTPIIEHIGLHRAGRITRAALNATIFPMSDHHDIVIALARRV